MKDVGIDITMVSRYDYHNEKLVNRILSNEELDVLHSLPDNSKNAYFASRFASKEAFFKATGDTTDYNKISVLNEVSGKPYIKGYPNLAISISDDEDYVIAIVIAKE